jgi:hypothetical protein
LGSEKQKAKSRKQKAESKKQKATGADHGSEYDPIRYHPSLQ